MKTDGQDDCKPVRLSNDAKARVRLCAELLGVLLATLLLIAALVVTVKVLCQRSVQARGSTAATTGRACGTAHVIDALVSNVAELVARSETVPPVAVTAEPCGLQPTRARS